MVHTSSDEGSCVLIVIRRRWEFEMSERHFYLTFLVFVAFGVIVLLRGGKERVPLRAGPVLFFVIVATLSTAWLLALKIARLVFGIRTLGWSSYMHGPVSIFEIHRHAIYLSDGRVLPSNLYQNTFAWSFFIGVVAIGSLLIKLISRISPSTGAAIMRLLSQPNQRRDPAR